jgi:hypothetical protein
MASQHTGDNSGSRDQTNKKMPGTNAGQKDQKDMSVIAWKPPEGKSKVIEAAFLNFRAAKLEAEASGTFDFEKHERARKAYSQYLRIADEIETESIVPQPKAIRLVGNRHTYHHDGAVLIITDSEAVACASPHAVALQHAHVLVAGGRAEWVADAGQAGR